MTTVSLLKCETYDREALARAVEASFKNIGFDPKKFKKARVALKPNLLTSSTPDQAVVTHPEFFRAVAQFVKKNGGKPVLIESPAIQPLTRVMKKTGYDELAREEGVEVVVPYDAAVIHNEKARLFKRFEVAKEILDADIIINIPKLKTHEITHITGAVKNLFGLIPGTRKAQWHMRAKTKEDFSNFLLDFYGAVVSEIAKGRPLITLMDAVVGMEGKGPGTSGTPKQIGAVLAGMDAIAVDYVAAGLVGADINKVLTITEGAKRGLGAASSDKITIKGDAIASFDVSGFAEPRSSSPTIPFPGLLKNLIVERPVPSADRCTLCYQCREICPAGAISRAQGKMKVPSYDYNKCIRCYCCMEVCPEAAISLRRGRLQWVINLVSR